MKKFLIAACALPVAAFISTAAVADVSAQLVVAANHAGFAAKADNVATVHMHLHHVVNCLVGPTGKGFDVGSGNPCAKAGNGAIPEASAAQKAKLMTALASANEGITDTDVMAAQKDATAAAAAINGAK
jgi:hypothetical protein